MIYCFFSLLVEYLGGEDEIMSILRGSPPTPHVFPLNYFLPPMDLSDPYTFLALKRGVMRESLLTEYVQLKPVLAIATVLLKVSGQYQDGRFVPQNGYMWISLMYSKWHPANRSFCFSGSVRTHGLLGLLQARAEAVQHWRKVHMCQRRDFLQLLALVAV